MTLDSWRMHDARLIDIWLAYYNEIGDTETPAKLREILSEDERRKETRFCFPDDRLRYLVTRAMVRTVLSGYAAVAPAQWVFTANSYGRPEIAPEHHDAQELRFNLSHTRGLIALCVSRTRMLGVDVEQLTRPAPLGIANRFLSTCEIAALASAPPAQRPYRFFEYWTFKESYIKARGMGLSIPLDRFSFDYPQADTVQLAVDPSLADDPERWFFWQLRPAPDYLLAVCAERLHGETPAFRVRRMNGIGAHQTLPVAPLKCSQLRAFRERSNNSEMLPGFM